MSSRPIPSREQAFSFSAASNSMSATALIYLLNNMSPKDLHDRLLSAVQGQILYPQDVDNLYQALEKIGIVSDVVTAAAKDQAIRHCARCHCVYMEKNNSSQACVILHEKPRLYRLNKAAAGPSSVNDPPYKQHYYCCNKLVDIAHTLPQPHFVGRHTTRAENVQFNGINVFDCHVRKCDVQATPAPGSKPASEIPSRPSTASSMRSTNTLFSRPLSVISSDVSMTSS